MTDRASAEGLRAALERAVAESRQRGYKTVVVALDDLTTLLTALRSSESDSGPTIEDVVRETMNVLGTHPWEPRTQDVAEKVRERLSTPRTETSDHD